METNTSQPESSNEEPFYKRRAFVYLAIACIALITTGIAAIFHKNYPGVNFKNLAAELIQHDVPPGGKRAVLTLASGKSIVLNEAADGTLGEEGNLIFLKTGNGQLRYEIKRTDGGDGPHPGFHSISTPRGGTYEITLPDGTVVWLNSASTMRFPINFSTAEERKIMLSGEGCFKVAKNVNNSFKVVTDQQLIQVLGTYFNVNNYIDESIVKTTLIKGAIKLRTVINNGSLSNEVILKTGQEAIIDHGSLNTVKADTAATLAWKNGFFLFDNEPLETIMKKIARWYDVEVIYQNVDLHRTFVGKISRDQHVSAVLKLLESAGGLHFKIQEGKIIAMN